MTPVRLLLHGASPGGRRARLSVLIFHRVLQSPDSLFPEEMDAARFDAICGWISDWFNVLPLDEAAVRLKAGTLPARAAAITFDDGYADNLHVALPILRRHGLVSTFFIATGFLDGGRMWNDTLIETVRGCRGAELDATPLGLERYPLGSVAQRRATVIRLIDQIKYRSLDERVRLGDQLAEIAGVRLPADLMMRSEDVRAMHAAGMQIGAHTVHHPILARLPADDAREEILGSRRMLEDLLGTRVGLFAYPNGKPGEDYLPENVQMVRALGFDAAVSTQWGSSRQGDDMFQIRRFTPWDNTRLRFGARLLMNLRSP